MGDPISRRQAVINEIQKAIEEIRHNGERHAEFVRVNGELVIAGLEMALDILNSAEPKPCDDTISRRAAIETLKNHLSDTDVPKSYPGIIGALEEWLDCLPSAQLEIIHCKDCKYYSPINKETKTGICNLTMHQNFGDNWFCAGAERRTDG